jgi:hypothetical protein
MKKHPGSHKTQVFQKTILRAGTNDISNPYDFGMPIHIGVLFIYLR